MPRVLWVWRVARNELRRHLRNQSFLILAALLVLLFGVAASVSYSAHRRSQAEMAALQATVARQWMEQPDRHPHRVAHYGYLVFRPRSSLGFFDFGVSDFTGNSIFLEAHVQNSANFSEARQDSALLRFGTLTPAFVLQLLIPLLIVFLVGRSVTSERESGTLAQALSLGLSWREFLLGKVLGGLGVLGLVIVPVVIGTAVLALGVGSSYGPEVWLRLALLGLVYLSYMLAWVVLSVLISARSASSGRAIVALLGLWIAFTTFLPKALPSAGAFLHPAPSRPEFESKLHVEVVKGGHGHDPKAAQFGEQKQQLLEQYGVETVEELPINWRGVAMREGEKASSEVYQHHFQELQEVYAAQDRVTEWGAVLSPYLLLKQLSSTLCGTDPYSAVEFERQAELYRYQLIQKLNDLHIEEIKFEGDKSQRLSAHHWGEFDSFKYRAPSLSQDLQRTRSTIILLGIQLFGFLALLLFCPRRVR